jgi:nucleotide-binding universal stress UspA family protein
VIIAFDGSAPAREAIVAAAKFLGGCRIVVATVWEEGLEYALATQSVPGEVGAAPPMVDPEVAGDVDRALHEQADDIARDGAALAGSLGLDAQPLAVADEEGNIARTLLALTRDQHAAAIVVGSRGLGGIRARLEGSTSRYLLRHASCPVVVVHEPGEAHH